MDYLAIEKQARLVQREIWKVREDLFPLGVPPTLALCEPEVAARALGLEYHCHSPLGRFGFGGDRYEIAGLLDRERGVIAVSTRYDYPVRRFTGAHEIGHYILHTGQLMHRDRPVFDTYDNSRSPPEKEADYFAACFLAPRKLVTQAFTARFIKGPPLPLTETVAWHLLGESAYELFSPSAGSLDFAAAVAGATSFNGKRFVSLHHTFGLSISAMAIRLQELGLVAD